MPVSNVTLPFPICPSCRCKHRQTKAGRTRHGDQRYQCQDCKQYYSTQNRRYRYPLPLREQAIRLYREGQSLRQIASQFAINHQTVSNWIKADGLANREDESPRYSR
jgi:transposase-like protein